jgi:hypothetical protein
MKWIGAWLRWCDYAAQQLNSWRAPKPPWWRAIRPRTAPASTGCVTSWRPLTHNSAAPGKRYLVRTAVLPNQFHLDIYDLRTCLSWRCVFRSQRERNTYLNALRTGHTNVWPRYLLAHTTSAFR